MPLLQRPAFPHCGSTETRLVKSPAALARLAAAVATAFVLADLVSLIWRCRGCGRAFLAVGDRARGGLRGRSFCVRCGYNLTGNTSGTCPECGTAVSAEAKP